MNYENPIRKGKLYFRYGTMGSAKTAMLLTTAYNFEERGMDYICMKPIVDNREKDSVIRSRIGIERRCSWIYPESDMYKMLTEVFDTEGLKEWILIDEAQFLSPEQVDQLARIVDNFGVNVLCYGLRTDFQSHLFDGSRRLFEIADTIDEVKSTCTCGRKTIINARIDRAGNVVMDGEQVEIGGNDKYMAMCRRCWAKRRCERDRIESLDFGKTTTLVEAVYETSATQRKGSDCRQITANMPETPLKRRNSGRFVYKRLWVRTGIFPISVCRVFPCFLHGAQSEGRQSERQEPARHAKSRKSSSRPDGWRSQTRRMPHIPRRSGIFPPRLSPLPTGLRGWRPPLG